MMIAHKKMILPKSTACSTVTVCCSCPKSKGGGGGGEGGCGGGGFGTGGFGAGKVILFYQRRRRAPSYQATLALR